MKILTYITNYEGNKKLNFLHEIIKNLEKIICTEHDVIIFSTDQIDIKSDILNIDIVIKPKIFSNSKYAEVWQPEPEFIWLHRKDLMTKVNRYDFFIHLEDDICLTKENFNYFKEENSKLPDNEVIGFIVYEEINNIKHLPSMHPGFSNKFINNSKTNYFTPTNLHSASWLLERRNLLYTINKGLNANVKLSKPYNIKCTACTEFYIYLKKMIPKKNVENSLIKHLSNKYFNKTGKMKPLDYKNLLALIK